MMLSFHCIFLKKQEKHDLLNVHFVPLGRLFSYSWGAQEAVNLLEVFRSKNLVGSIYKAQETITVLGF